MAARKPLVLTNRTTRRALASEEIAIRAIVDHEIDTYDHMKESEGLAG